MIYAMWTLLVLFIPVGLGLYVLFMRNAEATKHLPRLPFGADAEPWVDFGPDADRIAAEIDAIVHR